MVDIGGGVIPPVPSLALVYSEDDQNACTLVDVSPDGAYPLRDLLGYSGAAPTFVAGGRYDFFEVAYRASYTGLETPAERAYTAFLSGVVLTLDMRFLIASSALPPGAALSDADADITETIQLWLSYYTSATDEDSRMTVLAYDGARDDTQNGVTLTLTERGSYHLQYQFSITLLDALLALVPDATDAQAAVDLGLSFFTSDLAVCAVVDLNPEVVTPPDPNPPAGIITNLKELQWTRLQRFPDLLTQRTLGARIDVTCFPARTSITEQAFVVRGLHDAIRATANPVGFTHETRYHLERIAGADAAGNPSAFGFDDDAHGFDQTSAPFVD